MVIVKVLNTTRPKGLHLGALIAWFASPFFCHQEAQGQAGLGGGATVSVLALRYDSQNRLLSTNEGTHTVATKNRATSRTINGTTTYFLWDGWDLIEERDASGTQIRRYVHGPVTDELLMMVDASGAKYYHQDVLGSVTALTGSAGTIIEKYEYDVFGTPAIYDVSNTLLAASAAGNRFLYTGREWIAEASLYDYRNRVFSPVLGRFLQTDPIGFDGEDVNIYRYVFNMPGDFVDPYGLHWTDFPIGMGDAFSGDLTKSAREKLGLEDYYDPCSPEYQAGRKLADLIDWLNPKGWFKNGLKQGVKKGGKKAANNTLDKPFKKKKPGVSGKEGAKDKPSWVKEGPREGESGKEFAKRQMDDKYGEGNWEGTGPSSEFNKIKKWADRSFE